MKQQRSVEFHRLLNTALAIDIGAHPEDRLANTLMRRRSQRLKASSEDLFLDDRPHLEVMTSTGSNED